jgi:hypothetical protein
LIVTSLSADYKTGFGGKFGVQTDRVDKTAVGWDHNEKVRRVTAIARNISELII